MRPNNPPLLATLLLLLAVVGPVGSVASAVAAFASSPPDARAGDVMSEPLHHVRSSPPHACTTATPFVWVSTPVLANETALVVVTRAPAADPPKQLNVAPVGYARLCPRGANHTSSCIFVPMREDSGSNVPLSAAKRWSGAERSVGACAFTVPVGTEVHSWDVSLCRTSKSESCASTTRPLNVPSVVWLQGNRGNSSEPGGVLRLFGRALFFAKQAGPLEQTEPVRCVPEREAHTMGSASLPMVRVRPANQATVAWTELKVTIASCYAISAEVPTSFAPGAYKISVMNGISPWEAIDETLMVVGKRSWPIDVFDVKEYGSVWNAIDAARNNSGGIVHFPRGTYTFDENHTLDDIPPNTVVRGESAAKVSLHWVDMRKPPYRLISGSKGNWTLTNITVHVQLNFKTIISDRGW